MPEKTAVSQNLNSVIYCRVMCPKDADGMANSIDPDETAPSGVKEQFDQGLHYLPRLKKLFWEIRNKWLV